MIQLQLHLQQGLVVRPLQTERWRITMSLSRGINTKSSIKLKKSFEASLESFDRARRRLQF